MNILEWIFGIQEAKSETEIYMEQRNKKYAERVAMYKMRELVSGKPSGNTNASYTKAVTQHILSQINKNLDDVVKMETNSHVTQNTIDATKNGNMCFANNKHHHEDIAERYAEANSSEFVVSNGVKSGNTLLAFGEVIRGGFETGDTVVIHTSTGSVKAKIETMAREKSEIKYANTASGKIRMLFINVPNDVRNGDKIVKSRFVR